MAKTDGGIIVRKVAFIGVKPAKTGTELVGLKTYGKVKWTLKVVSLEYKDVQSKLYL
jgi:hypothetical protein